MRALNTLIFSALMAVGLALGPAPAKAGESAFSQAELDQILAPVALYPDTVLSHVLIASTYPLEIIQAARWSRANPNLSGEKALDAVDDMDWDPSVMALVAFPELLARMDEDIEWTQRLGDAFLVQEEQVVDTVQRLRERAYAQGNLKTNEHVRVVRETEYIYIEPRRTRVVYVPYYDPRVVYGPWWWSAHPPVYWHHPRYVSSVTFYWGPAYRVAPRFYFSSFHWSRRQVVVVNHHHHYYRSGRHFSSGREIARHSDSRRWQHNPHHRRGVSYHRNVSERRFVEQPSGQTVRMAGNRPVQARSNQRDWAAERRDNLDISQRSTARASARSEQSASPQRQIRGGDSGARSTSRLDQSAVSQRRQAEGSRSQPTSERATTSRRQASEVRESLSSREQNRSRTQEVASRSNRTEPAGQRAAIPRQQRDDSRPSVSIPRANTPDVERGSARQRSDSQRPARSAPQASRRDAGSVSSRLQATRPSTDSGNTTTRTRATDSRSAAASQPRQSQPRSSAPQPATRQTSPVSGSRSAPAPRQSPQQSAPTRPSSSAPARSAPRQSPQQSAPNRQSSSAPARSAPRSTPPRSSGTTNRSSSNRGSSNRSATSPRSSTQSRVRSRGGNREQ